MREVWSALSMLGLRMFRNTVGACATAAGGWIQYGLSIGSSDLIGWHSAEVTPGMVGKRVAIFTAVEVKRPGKPLTNEQNVFLRNVREAGGIAFIARDPANVEAQIADALDTLGE